MKSSASKFTAKQKLDELWRRGVVVPILCHPVQQSMAKAIHESTGKKYVINSSRRLGKSYLLCCLAIERALQFPHQQIKFASETQRSVKKIILPLFRAILESCPRDLRPKFHAHDNVFTFHNGSEIHLAGSAMDQADSLRGTACDLALIDEAGFIDGLEYLIDSILLPQTLGRTNPKIILASTPSKTPDHPFVSRFMAEAMAGNYYSKYTIYDNPRLTPEMIAEFMVEAGGADTTVWRREYLAEPVTDLSNAVFPEATHSDAMDAMIYEVQRPAFFVPFVAMDLGYLDFTGVVFGYYHFPLAKIVIEDEILVNRATSAEIVAMVAAKEKELWGHNVPRMRVVDGPALVLADLNATHRMACRLPDKADLSASVNRVRMDLAANAFVFHPRCKNLIAQLRYAIWDNSRTKFARSASAGHFDLAAAILYFAKHLDRITNPYPAAYGYDAHTDWGFPRQHPNTAQQGIRTMFPRLFRKSP